VTRMSNMFHNAYSFNQDLSDWDVGNVETFTYMFTDTTDMSTQWCLTSEYCVGSDEMWCNMGSTDVGFCDDAHDGCYYCYCCY
jgi:surface protein